MEAFAYDEIAGSYPYATLWINGRHAAIEKIQQDLEIATTPFEETVFQFVRDWFNGVDDFVMTTSGSTGVPKNITISRSQMIGSAILTSKRIRLKKNSTALVCIDPKYIGGRMMLVRSFVFGLRIMAIDPTSNPLIKLPVDRTVQVASFVPYQIQSIVESKHPHLLDKLDTILIGGAPLNATLREQLNGYQCECYETYGMTETISHIALRLVNTPARQSDFEVLPGVNISQDDRDCLVIEAPHLDARIITNDIVEVTGPGRFVWLGRWDSVINTGGFKVLPEKIEPLVNEVFRHNNLDCNFFIAALPDEKLGSKVVLILEGVHFSSEILERSLREIKQTLHPYEVPKEVYFNAEFNRTPTQKTDRIQSLAQATLLSFVQ